MKSSKLAWTVLFSASILVFLLLLLGADRILGMFLAIICIAIGMAAIGYADRLARLRTWGSSGFRFRTARRLNIIGGIAFVVYGIGVLVVVLFNLG